MSSSDPLPSPGQNRFVDFWKRIYHSLVKIHDSPQRITIGFGLGVALGILPGTGPVASLFLASFFRVNKIAALTGSVLTNTWLSVVTFALAVKIGAAFTGVRWEEVQAQCLALLNDFHWRDIFNITILNILKPLLLGYLVISLASGLVGYLLAVAVLRLRSLKRHL